MVLLSGEAGIAKSGLTSALMEIRASGSHARSRHFCSPPHPATALLRYFFSPLHTDSAFDPIMVQMELVAGLVHDDTPQARLDKLDAVLPHTSTSIDDAALFAEMLSLPNDGRYRRLELTSEQRRQ